MLEHTQRCIYFMAGLGVNVQILKKEIVICKRGIHGERRAGRIWIRLKDGRLQVNERVGKFVRTLTLIKGGKRIRRATK